jgi:histidinol-phosphatase (PHP family)
MPLVSDYHNHPQAHRTDLHYSPEVLQPWADKARELGLRDLAFTDHDRYKAGVDFGEIDRLRAANPDVNIRAGIELDNDPETSADGRRWVEANWDKLDFVLGSVHFVEGFPFDHPNYISEYDKHDINDLYRKYYALIQDAAKSGLVDGLGHLDLIGIFKYFPTEDMTALYEETLDVIKAADVCMEINTAGFRKPVGRQYPDMDLIRRAVAKKIPLTISSDAHAAKDLNMNYDKLELILKEVGVTEVAIFHKHQRTMVPVFV